MRIPFDGVVLSAVLSDLRPFVGGLVQDVRQPEEHSVCLGLYKGGAEAMLLLSSDPVFCRAYLITRRPANSPQPPAFCAALRSRIGGATLISASQIASDRILLLAFRSDKGEHRLIAEIMGKHSNLILVDSEERIVAAAKWVGRDKSSRPVGPNGRYEWPPVLDRQLLDRPSPDSPEGWTRFAQQHKDRTPPFFLRLMEARAIADPWTPVLSPAAGAYPLNVSSLGFEVLPRPSISVALEQHFARAIPEHLTEARRSALLASMGRVLLARATALADISTTLKSDAKSRQWQLMGELILAYGPAAESGSDALQAVDYEGKPLTVRLDPALDYKQNAAAYFERAKRAKGRAGVLQDQIVRLSVDRERIQSFTDRVTSAPHLSDVEDLWAEAKQNRWLTEQRRPAAKEDRPYQGHRIRELLAPGGFRVLYGENAESNDYLTLRVAKPNDMWLHLRGSTSAHVVILTAGHPDKVGREQLEFAAKIAVQQSPSKHAGYVPVDYTLKRYVSKPRGAPKGTALYTHEKTVHVES